MDYVWRLNLSCVLYTGFSLVIIASAHPYKKNKVDYIHFPSVPSFPMWVAKHGNKAFGHMVTPLWVKMQPEHILHWSDRLNPDQWSSVGLRKICMYSASKSFWSCICHTYSFVYRAYQVTERSQFDFRLNILWSPMA